MRLLPGSLRTLFDLSLSDCAPLRLLRLFYGAVLLSSTVAGAGVLYLALRGPWPRVLLGVVLVPTVLVAVLAGTRVLIEFLLVSFRAGEHVAEVAEHGAAIAVNTAPLTRGPEAPVR